MRKKLIRNITVAAMLIALTIIFEKLIVIQLPPFIRIGIGSIPVVLGSIVLGPLFGAVIGVTADVVGFFLFDITGYAYTPFVTISFLLLGVLPFYLFKLTKMMRYQKKPWPIGYALLAVIWAFMVIFVFTQTSVRVTGTVYQIDLSWKIFLPIISAVVFIIFSFFIYFNNRYFQKKVLFFPKCPSPHEVSFVILVMEIIINIIWGSIWKNIFFGVPLLAVLFAQSVILIFTYPVKTFIVNYVLMTYYRYVDQTRSDSIE